MFIEQGPFLRRRFNKMIHHHQCTPELKKRQLSFLETLVQIENHDLQAMNRSLFPERLLICHVPKPAMFHHDYVNTKSGSKQSGS